MAWLTERERETWVLDSGRAISLRKLAALGKYVVKAARFDPSKGFPDVINTCMTFLQKVEEVMLSKTPQL